MSRSKPSIFKRLGSAIVCAIVLGIVGAIWGGWDASVETAKLKRYGAEVSAERSHDVVRRDSIIYGMIGIAIGGWGVSFPQRYSESDQRLLEFMEAEKAAGDDKKY